MEGQTRAPGSRIPLASYDQSKWDSKRSIIHQLYIDESKTVDEIVDILEKEHKFRVNNQMLTYRLRLWKIRKNCTKIGIKEYFQSSPDTGVLRFRSGMDKARLLNGAKRHHIQVPSAFAESLVSPGSNIKSPDVYNEKEAMLTLVANYVSGAFDSRIWDSEQAPAKITKDYLDWACGSTPSSFKVLSNMFSARMCYEKGKEEWAGVLFRAGFAELNICLRDQPYQTLPIILIVLGSLRKQLLNVGKCLLDQCRGLAEIFPHARPIIRIFDQVAAMQQGQYEDGFYDSLFTTSVLRFVDELSAKLGESGSFVCALLRNSNPLLAVSEAQQSRSTHPWVHPVTRRYNDPEHFNSSRNIEQSIVQAVELYGYQQLLQMKEALEQQRSAAVPNGEVYQKITRHLKELEVLIHRIGCRDSAMSDNRDRFVERWTRWTDDLDSSPHVGGSEYILDMLVAWKTFTVWGKIGEAQQVESRLLEVLININKRLL